MFNKKQARQAPDLRIFWCPQGDSNPRPFAPEFDFLMLYYVVYLRLYVHVTLIKYPELPRNTHRYTLLKHTMFNKKKTPPAT